MQSIIAKINPVLLVWARKTSGLELEVAAKKIGVAAERLKAWECGTELPTIAQLRKAGQTFKRPISIFYLSKVPDDFDVLRDFRRLPIDIPSDFSPELCYLIRRSKERQEWAKELRRQEGWDSPISGIVSQDNPIEESASVVRSILGVSLDHQSTWKSTDIALREWIVRIETLGVFVFQSSEVEPLEMRGFALVDPMAPVILINSKDARAARIFTAMHEFVHVLIGAEGLSNLTNIDSPITADQRTELFCNKLASEILMPNSDFIPRADMLIARNSADRAIEALSTRYSVSREVVARRLMDLKYVSREYYERKREHYLLDFELSRPSVKEFRIPRATMVLRDNGRSFSRMVLGAYGDRQITAGDMSNLLRIKLQHLEKLRGDV